MKFILEMRMANSEGVLERILGRLRQRNISFSSFAASCSYDQAAINATITIDSTKSSESVLKQLGKLYDVQQMKVYFEPTARVLANNYHEREQNEVCLPV